MENKIITERLGRLREVMKKEGIDYYMIPTADFHNSEYVSDYFKVREYFSNFSGSNGNLLVWQGGAGLWTDGRYFLQAEKELSGTGITLFKMQEEDVPTIEEFLEQQLKDGETLGFDGRVLSAAEGLNLEKLLTPKQGRIAYTKDPAEGIWADRPTFPNGKVWMLPTELAGQSVAEKLQNVRTKMQEEGAKGLLLTKLDDLMWLFNIRGCDVECNPVAMSYGYITGEEAVLFLKGEPEAPEQMLQNMGCNIKIADYDSVVTYLEQLPEGQKVMVDRRYCSYALYKTLEQKQKIIEHRNPTEVLKAIKNPIELAHMERIYLQDSVAVTKFIYWLKTHIGKEEMTEISVADKLEQFRREIPEFLDLSFPTIAGYGANGAIVHYEATAENHEKLAPEGLLLVDSGGQYLGGTTDVTRTIALGKVTDEMKKHYTLVAAGMLKLAGAKWLYGCTGRNLDILARQSLWEEGLDYKHGTGHGIGYILNVHEGPQNIRWRYLENSPGMGMTEAVLEEGMVVSDEPGIYITGSHGIRIENILAVKKGQKNDYGQFMHFDMLTWVPLDKDALDDSLLDERTRKLLHMYQKKVYEKLAPYLTEEEREWLKAETL